MKTILEQEETEILKAVLHLLKVQKRTGDLGIIHGANQFVSTNVRLRKNELHLLDKIASKVGLTSGLAKVD